MTSSSVPEQPSCHILDFFHDDEDSSALTALINGVRFHIVVDAEHLREAGHDSLLTEYLLLLQNVKNLNEDAALPEATRSSAFCPDHDSASDGSDPPTQAELKIQNVKNDTDSAIDLSADNDTRSKRHASHSEIATEHPERKLQNWILSFFQGETAELAPAQDKTKKRSLEEWYSGTTYFFDLDADGDQLAPRRLEKMADLQDKIKELVPRMIMPKYIRDTDLPWVNASDITVCSEVPDPEPVHPGVVRVGQELQFFKPVDPSQPQVTKREIKISQKLAKLGLGNKIRVPRLLGLVAFEESSTEIMGMLLTSISETRPLTTLLSSEVPEPQRLRWADESKDMVKILHENGIIWGDAKADNFLVDENDELWIIDFGGSYTEGWIDPEISETKEGDKMGVEKIVEALIDPDENTFDPEDDVEEDSDYVPQFKKRKRSSPASSENGQKKSKKG